LLQGQRGNAPSDLQTIEAGAQTLDPLMLSAGTSIAALAASRAEGD
jgi:hypothetical protein